MPLTGPEHYRAAEKLLSRASFERSPSDPSPSLDPQVADLLIARAQVHATLAATAASAEILADRYVGDGEHVNDWRSTVGRPAGRPGADVVAAYVHDDHDAAFEPSCTACVDERAASASEQLEAMRNIVGGHIAEGLDSSDRELRDFLRGLAYELGRAGVSIEDTVKRAGLKYQYLQHQFLVDDVFYSLDHQYVDALGVTWEHAGTFDGLHEPVMCTPDLSPALPHKPLPELVWSRGPLRPTRPSPWRSFEEGWPGGPTFDPDAKVYRAHGWPERVFDLSLPLEDNDGGVWRWTGEFEAPHGEPLIKRDGDDGYVAILSAIEVFRGPVHQLETEDDAEPIRGGSS